MIDQTTLITGASSGIGMHLAREFASHGHPLVLVAPVEEELCQIADGTRAERELAGEAQREALRGRQAVRSGA